MGYDFVFKAFKVPPERYPSRAGSGDERFVDDDALLDKLRSLPNARASRAYDCKWDTPDGGSLGFDLRTTSEDMEKHWEAMQAMFPALAGLPVPQYDWIRVDTHAHWRYVLEAFELLRPLVPNLVLGDAQTAMLYDSASFAEFIKTSYREG